MSENRIKGCVFKNKAILLRLREKKQQESAASKEESKNETENSVNSEPVNVDLDVSADTTAKPRKHGMLMDSDDERPQSNITNDLTATSAANEDDNQMAKEINESTEIQTTNQALDESFKTAINSHDVPAIESKILQLDSGTNLTEQNTDQPSQINTTMNQNSQPSITNALTTTSTAAESDKRIAGDSNESIEKNQPTNEALDESNIGLNATEATKLFQDSDEDEKVEESRLMALCSGTFVTQYPESLAEKNSDQSTECEGSTEVSAQLVKVQKNNIQSIEVKTAFLSSDDEETVSQVKKKRKKPLLLDSDNEQDTENAAKLEGESDNKTKENSSNRIFDQPAQCPTCMKNFQRRDNIIRHYKNTCNGVTYNCKFCKFCAITTEELEIHTRKIHTKKLKN